VSGWDGPWQLVSAGRYAVESDTRHAITARSTTYNPGKRALASWREACWGADLSKAAWKHSDQSEQSQGWGRQGKGVAPQLLPQPKSKARKRPREPELSQPGSGARSTRQGAGASGAQLAEIYRHSEMPVAT